MNLLGYFGHVQDCTAATLGLGKLIISTLCAESLTVSPAMGRRLANPEWKLIHQNFPLDFLFQNNYSCNICM